jgi:hypothetical protein
MVVVFIRNSTDVRGISFSRQTNHESVSWLWALHFFVSRSFRMGSLQERIAACANAAANLLAQLSELDELREQVRKAQLSLALPKRPLKRPASVGRRVLKPSAVSR